MSCQSKQFILVQRRQLKSNEACFPPSLWLTFALFFGFSKNLCFFFIHRLGLPCSSQMENEITVCGAVSVAAPASSAGGKWPPARRAPAPRPLPSTRPSGPERRRPPLRDLGAPPPPTQWPSPQPPSRAPAQRAQRRARRLPRFAQAGWEAGAPALSRRVPSPRRAPASPPPVVASVTSSSWQQAPQPGTEEPV